MSINWKLYDNIERITIAEAVLLSLEIDPNIAVILANSELSFKFDKNYSSHKIKFFNKEIAKRILLILEYINSKKISSYSIFPPLFKEVSGADSLTKAYMRIFKNCANQEEKYKKVDLNILVNFKEFFKFIINEPDCGIEWGGLSSQLMKLVNFKSDYAVINGGLQAVTPIAKQQGSA